MLAMQLLLIRFAPLRLRLSSNLVVGSIRLVLILLLQLLRTRPMLRLALSRRGLVDVGGALKLDLLRVEVLNGGTATEGGVPAEVVPLFNAFS